MTYYPYLQNRSKQKLSIFLMNHFWQYCTIREFFRRIQIWKKMNGNRGSKHFIYMNRTFLDYNLMFDLKATIVVNEYKKYN
jgi:hypothetical protein